MRKLVQITTRLHSADNVVFANEDIAVGTSIITEGFTAKTPIPRGHKVATTPIATGDTVRKYNQIIGFAAGDITPGEHVHTHNVEVREFARDYTVGNKVRPTDYVSENQRASFKGFVRADGRVGTRNYVGVLTSVNCSATVARYIADHFREDRLANYANVDGVAAFVHNTGCGMQQNGKGHNILKRVLSGYERHPNFGGILIVGLGCEVNQISDLIKEYGLEQGDRLRTLTIQDTGGTQRAVDKGVAIVKNMLPIVDKARRVDVPASELTLALQCGGSDSYSGVSANPALGAASDLLVRHGGTAILSETPEIYGAEHLLIGRAQSSEVAEKLVARIRWWEEYTATNSAEMNNNPSPGNKAGGITTILEKALGSTAKSGTTNLVDVYEYAEPVAKRGFVFMDSPGYDPASVTGQVASGANIVCFTTGRGSAFGFKPAPSIKIGSNTHLYNRMKDEIDINCGEIVDGNATVEEMGRKIFDLILRVASGEKSASEQLGFGDNEFVPWQIGAVM